MAEVALKRDLQDYTNVIDKYNADAKRYTKAGKIYNAGVADYNAKLDVYNKQATVYNNSLWNVGGDPVQFRREFGDSIKYFGVNHGGQLISKKNASRYTMIPIPPTNFGSNLYVTQLYAAPKPDPLPAFNLPNPSASPTG